MYRTLDVDRSRSRGAFVTHQAVYGVKNFASGVTTFYNYPYTSGSVEHIEDKYQPYGIGVWPMKSLFRRRVALSVTPASMPCRRCSNTGGTCSGETIWNGRGGLVDDASWTDVSLGDAYHPDTIQLPADMRSELAGRMEASLPTIYRGLPNLIRSLAELKDMAATVRSIGQTLDLFRPDRAPSEALKATLRGCEADNINFWRAARSFRQNIKTGIVQTMAGDVLAWTFAIAPYVNDLKQLIKNAADVKTRIEALRKGLGKVHTQKVFANRSSSENTEAGISWRCSASCDGCPNAASVPMSEIALSNRRETRTSHQAVLTFKYRYELPLWAQKALTEGEALCKYMLDGFNTTTVVELLPFEFVLEWFLNTRPLLTGNLFGLNDNKNDCQVEIVDTSLTYVIEEGVTSQTGIFELGTVQTEIGTRKYVYRWVGDHAVNRLAWVFKLPSWMQFALGAAMVTSNIRYTS